MDFRFKGLRGTLVLVTALVGLSVQASTKIVRMALTAEPPNLASFKTTDTESFFVLGHVMEGLTRYDQNNNIVGGVAERWIINEKEATFFIRKNAKWSDGQPVTAHDFVYAWQTVVNPKTASEYAFILYYLKNAEKIVQGKAKPADLGVRAVDDHTLKVEFERPCAFFPALVAFGTYLPLRKDVHEKFKDKYAADHDKMIFNGPFMLTRWVHGASLRMDKNPHYWNAAKVKLDAIDAPYITPDDMARFNLFKDKKIDLLGLSRNNLANAQREKMKIDRYADGAMFFLEFNQAPGKVAANDNFRKAINLVINKQEYVSKVLAIPGTIIAQGVIPSYMNGVTKKFRQEFPRAVSRPNVAEAKKLMAQAQKELKMEKLPPIVWLTGDSPTAAKEAEYYQNLFKSTLGLDLRIDRQIFKQRLAKQKAGEFDIVSAAWGPDYNDPMTFADLFTSWNENNHGKWSNPKYDQLIRKAMDTADQSVRMKAMAEAEAILMDDVGFIPVYERIVMYTMNPKLTGVVRRAVGVDPDLSQADIR